jgi:hypothetical protein
MAKKKGKIEFRQLSTTPSPSHISVLNGFLTSNTESRGLWLLRASFVVFILLQPEVEPVSFWQRILVEDAIVTNCAMPISCLDLLLRGALFGSIWLLAVGAVTVLLYQPTGLTEK